MGLRESISLQFGKPRGSLGRLAGFIMSTRSSNRERIAWAVSLLAVKPEDAILEIGFGPGVGISLLCGQVDRGFVYGVDHSPLMVRTAIRRNKGAVKAGWVALRLASISELPPFDRKLDRILDINTYQFWGDPRRALANLRLLMSPGGTIAIAHQPRTRGAVRQDAIDAGERIAAALSEGGFIDVKIEMRDMKPVPTVCVLGRNPE